MKKRINIQYMVLAFVTIVAAVGISSLVFYNILKQEVLGDMRNYVDIFIGADAWGMVSDPDDINEQKVIESYDGNLRVTFINSEGYAVVDNLVEISDMENHNERPEVVEARKNGHGSDIRKSETLQKNSFYYAVALDNGYVLRVSREVSSMTSIMLSALPVVILLCIVLFIISLVSSHFLTKSIVEPIEFLADNMDASDSIKVYKELVPFVNTIKRQHEDIMRNANMRQEFTANVSHELRTPITVVRGYAEMLHDDVLSGEEDVRGVYDRILLECQGMERLVQDLFLLSKMQNPDFQMDKEPVSLAQIFADVMRSARVIGEDKEIHFVVDIPEEQPFMIEGDYGRLRQMFLIVLDNAVKFSERGGKVHLTLVSRDGLIKAQIADQGIGIAPEELPYIFEKFYKSKLTQNEKGTGLGLMIAKQIILRHGGDVEVQSVPGEGTTFTFTFMELTSLEEYE